MLPEAFLERMQQMLGDEYEAFLESFEQERYQALRLNALKIGADGRSAAQVFGTADDSAESALDSGESADESAVEKAGGSQFAHLTKVPWAENGYYYEAADQPGKHPYHEAGVYYIQEPSAMAPVELLEVQPGERVLDLCAAPGGKSTQIAAKLKRQGFLLCNEIHPARAKILSENVERMGIANACVTNETPAHLAEIFPEYFDKILVDAPCSGEGMFRKNEAACDEWSLENVQLCAERQDEILDCAAGMLAPGGRLVYSTCTFAPAENEGSISRFLERHPEFMIVSSLRLWPHRIKGEGHFAAVLQKAGQLPEGYRRSALNGMIKPVSEKELGAFVEFVQESIVAEETSGAVSEESVCCAEKQREKSQKGKDKSSKMQKGQAVVSVLPAISRAVGLDGPLQYITFGENLYLVSADMPSVKGMKVLRPGLHLGTLKKNRFEPSHALALALNPAYATHVWNLDSGEPVVAAYLNGQTFSAEGDKGWYLICVDGFGLGWGKLAGGIMKNHYPKGLRK